MPRFCVVLTTTLAGTPTVEGVGRIIKRLDDCGCFPGQSRYKVNISGDVVERFVEDALVFKTQQQADRAYFAKKAELANATQ